MARSSQLGTVFVMFVCSGLAQADISTEALFIKTRDYQTLNTDDDLWAGAIDPEKQKVSGIVPSVGPGIAVWTDGRSGKQAIMGHYLQPAASEFVISEGHPTTDLWQENNPFVGLRAHEELERTWVVYNSGQTGGGAGDNGDIEGSFLPPLSPSWLVQELGIQQYPVFANASAKTYLGWIRDTGIPSSHAGFNKKDIYTAPTDTMTPAKITTTDAARDSLAGDGKYLVWEELRAAGGPMDTADWDIAVYNLDTATLLPYIDGPNTPWEDQKDPDIDGNLLVWTEEHFPNPGDTNIYFKPLDIAGHDIVTITTGDHSGVAAKAAVSRVDDDTAFVIWQDRFGKSEGVYGVSNQIDDYDWDIWAQELELVDDGGTWTWILTGDAFGIEDAMADGRQTNPDIYGLDVVWQSQVAEPDPNTKDIYVWGPVPEPCTAVLIVAGIPLLARRRKLGRPRRQTG